MHQDNSTKPRNLLSKYLGRYHFFLLAVLLFALHIGAVFYFLPPKMIFGEAPLSNLEWELVAAQNSRALASLKNDGQLWSYDPALNAGIPTAVENDSNSRAWQYGTFWLSGSPLLKGKSPHLAANLLVLLAHLLLPVILFLSARLFGQSRTGTLLTLTFGLILWFFDGYFHWIWWSGSLAYGFAAYLVLCTLALLYRFTESAKWAWVLPALVVGFFSVFVHAYIAIPLALVGGIMAGTRGGKLNPPGRVMAWGIVVLPILANLYWIYLGLSFWSSGDNDPALGVGGISFLLTDFLGINQDVGVTGGIGVRSGFRFLVFGAAAFTFTFWKSQKDGRLRPLMFGVASLLLLAYCGGYLPLVREIQPYRHLIMAVLLALIPAGQFVDEVAARGALGDLPRMAKIVLVIILLAAIPRLARDVVYFVPDFVILPEDLPEETPHISDIIGFGGIGYPRHRDYRHNPPPKYVSRLARGLKFWEFSQGRVLVEYAPLAERLARSTKAHLVGSSAMRNRAFRAADFFVRYPESDPTEQVVANYFDTYAIGWVVTMSNPDYGAPLYVARFHGMERLFEGQQKIWPFQVMRTKTKISYFKEGSGEIETSLNQIAIKNSPSEQDLVVKFHWFETLTCRSGCKIEKEPIAGDPLGFIRIPAPHPSDIIIENGY